VAGRRPRYARQDQGKRQTAILEFALEFEQLGAAFYPELSGWAQAV